MKIIIVLAFPLVIFTLLSTQAMSFPESFPLARKTMNAATPETVLDSSAGKSDADAEWVSMPAGGKAAYMGIHGGTMPVSLLVSRDGSSLFTFVGQTGNDFLDVLRNAFLPFPSFGNSTRDGAATPPASPSSLVAGNLTDTMPVIALSGDRLAKQAWLQQLRPFGLSPKPLTIEGQVARPERLTPEPRHRVFFLPDYFSPRRLNSGR